MVSIITSTIRQNSMNNVFRNYANQDISQKELIVVLNSKKVKHKKWIREAKKYPSVSVYRLPDKTLGECLNFGIQKAKYPIVAKFDDDDYYAPQYLTQAVHALITNGASVVGKMSWTTYFEGKKIIAVMRPNNENKFIDRKGFIGGGTIVFKKDVFFNVKFPKKNTSEDAVFQKRCLKKGYKIYSTDRYHYVSIRRKNKRTHTWKAEDEEVLKKCKVLARTEDYKSYVEGRWLNGRRFGDHLYHSAQPNTQYF